MSLETEEVIFTSLCLPTFMYANKSRKYFQLTLYQCRNTWSLASPRWPPPPPGFRSRKRKSCGAESLCCRWRQPLLGTDGCPRCTSRQKPRGRNSAAALQSQSRKAAKKETRERRERFHNFATCKSSYSVFCVEMCCYSLFTLIIFIKQIICNRHLHQINAAEPSAID